jgi:uracil-DNA glycosylase
MIANPLSLREVLAFYRDAGVTDALDDLPRNRFAAVPPQPVIARPESSELAAKPSLSRTPAPAIAARPSPSVPTDEQAKLARELAAGAATLQELRERMAGFEGCNLRYTAKNLVFADGNPAARLMLVGEAPGRDEDIEGLPFVGKSGQLLDRILAAIGLDRASVYIANVIPWRPPGNRTPTPQETEICRPFIERQIELVNPAVMMTLGGASSKVILKTTEGVLRLRGSWRSHVTPGEVSIPTMPTLHPAYLLRTPAHKKLAWRDFLEAKAKLASLT